MVHPFISALLLGLQVSTGAVSQEPTATVATTARFELRSDPRVALHHFLIDWAAADAGEWPPYALPLAERENWQSLLDVEEQHAWRAAVESYAATSGRSLLFDEGMLAVRDWAVGRAARSAIPSQDQALADALDSALPIFRRHWWAAHDARNRAWIDSLSTTLAAIEDQVIARMEAAYGGRWPAERIPIDVMVYTNPVGAYSTAGRLSISSVDRGNQMPQALEMVFHEASHVDPLEQPLRRSLNDAFTAAGVEEPDRFWHDVIFYTSGEITKIVLAEHGQPGYQHYGELGVYRRGERWSVELPAFERYWKPFLAMGSNDGRARRVALERVAREMLSGN